MALYKNTFQPYFPHQNQPNLISCAGSYCYPIAAGDIIHQQWYQTPCAGSLVENPNYEGTLGANLITNGTFTGSGAGWTFDGVTWVYNADMMIFTAINTVSYLTQSGIGLVAGNTYRVTFDVGVLTGGMQVMLGNASGATISDIIYSTGTYSLDMVYNDTDDIIQFFPGAIPGTNVFTLDNVTVRLVTVADWVTNGAWTLEDGVACKNAVGAGQLWNGTSDYIVNGDRYEVEVTMSSYTDGTLSVYVDDGTGGSATNIQSAISANGSYQYWFDASQDGVIGFAPSTDFIGCISNLTVKRLRNDYTFSLIDFAGDAIDVSSSAVYDENKISINIDLGAMYEAGDIDYGCFSIYVYDSCLISGDNLVQDGNFNNGDFTKWQRNSGAWQYSMGGGIGEFIFEPTLDNPTVVSNGDFASGATGWTADASWTITAGIGAVHTPGSTTTLSQTVTISAPAILPLVLYTWFQVRITGRTAGSVTLSVSDKTSAAMSTNDTHTNVFVPTIGGSVTLAITPTSNFDGTIELVHVSEATRSWNSKPILSNPANVDVVQGNYQLTYDITSITGTTINTIGASASIRYPLLGYTYDRAVATHSHTQDYTPGSTIIEIQGIFDSNSNYYPGRVTVDNYSVVRIEPFEATYQSECLNFQEEHEGTKLLTAWCDQDALGSTYLDDLGFESTDYILQMRVKCRSYNSFMDEDVNNAFFSNGDSALKYASLEMFWLFVTDFMSESALISLGAMIRCDHFTVGDSGTDEDTEYLAKIEPYTPEWRSEADYDLAAVIITLRLKSGGMKFNRHR